MALPIAILLSSLLLAAVLFYGFTRDRLPWKKIGLALVGLVVLLAVLGAGGIWWLRRSDAVQAREREARERELHRVVIGDSLDRVIERQGVPDTMFVPDSGGVAIGYRDYTGGFDKAFWFSPDSTLESMAFIGKPYTSIENGWTPLDGVVLGMPRDSVEALLGNPCAQHFHDSYTTLDFRTNRPDVFRVVHIGHGDETVTSQGWYRGRCR